ncbi:hypothetical protein B0H15DRAFT_831567 [Mycena belliarum]|uniref:Uncharacterized protein n=1 Tax=Mycena belliarum TaxID=1033014 RepID=A0AAD6U7N8_9AGAR|nr:hypothetical protein B0H15DRAFT_831567 [Mycena belliae]
MPVPTFTSARTGTVPILTTRFEAGIICNAISPAEQNALVTVLQTLRTEVATHGNTLEYFKGLGVMGANIMDADLAQSKAHVLDFINWRLAVALRYSTPTRIAEAVPYLEEVIACFESQNPDSEKDVTPLLYLAVALHKQPGKESDAVGHFRAAYVAAPAVEFQYRTQLWSRACFSRLLRRMGRTAEAEEQEKVIRDWLQWHPYGMPPSEFVNLVTDPLHEGPDYILDHPLVKRMFDGMVEMGPGMVVHFG